MRSATSPGAATAWVASLSPWPEEFGLDGMRSLLARLGDPQKAYPAVHVVGTNGKSTATRTIAELLRSEGLRVGAYTSPHVAGWHERLNCDEAGFERAVARVRGPAEELGSTQFEVLTAAALLEFAEQGVDVGGRRGGARRTARRDERRRRRGRPAHQRRAGTHRGARRDARGDRAGEARSCSCGKSSCHVGQHVRASSFRATRRSCMGGAREAAEAFLGRKIEHDADVSLAGRLERRDGEIRDGAHTPEAVDWLLARIPARDYVLCVSILREKRVDELLERLGRAGSTFVATTSSNPRALPAKELAAHAEAHFSEVLSVADPRQGARARALPLGAPSSSPAPSICSRTSTRERKTVQVDESWRTDHRLRVRGRRRAVDRGDRVRSRLHHRSTSPITGERK